MLCLELLCRLVGVPALAAIVEVVVDTGASEIVILDFKKIDFLARANSYCFKLSQEESDSKPRDSESNQTSKSLNKQTNQRQAGRQANCTSNIRSIVCATVRYCLVSKHTLCTAAS